jgi:ubiquinone/menaquinone biosynthesis C-methylase UbiE
MKIIVSRNRRLTVMDRHADVVQLWWARSEWLIAPWNASHPHVCAFLNLARVRTGLGLASLRLRREETEPISNREELDTEILAHYEEAAERERLLRGGAGRLEYLRTRVLLARHLPTEPATVLDVGGGAGVYALPLAREGYSVYLIDAVPQHVEQAREASTSQPDAPLAGALVGDARRLAWDDESVDAVLLLGPLYHLTSRTDRLRALREAYRVVRPGGVVAAAAISRFASTYDGLLRGFLEDPAFEDIVERDVREGQHRNPTGRPEWFTTAYFHLPEELHDEATAAGFSVEALVGIEGPGWILPDLDSWLEDPPRRSALLQAIRRVETEPSLLGATAHILVVGRRR